MYINGSYKRLLLLFFIVDYYYRLIVSFKFCYLDSYLNILVCKMAVYLNPCLSLPINLAENEFEDLIQKLKDWTIMHGYYFYIYFFYF
jgi:hypothetical protein